MYSSPCVPVEYRPTVLRVKPFNPRVLNCLTNSMRFRAYCEMLNVSIMPTNSRYNPAVVFNTSFLSIYINTVLTANSHTQIVLRFSLLRGNTTSNSRDLTIQNHRTLWCIYRVETMSYPTRMDNNATNSYRKLEQTWSPYKFYEYYRKK